MPAKSPPNARRSGFASDLKIKCPHGLADYRYDPRSLSKMFSAIGCFLPSPELIALRRAVNRTGPFIAMAEDHSAFLQIIGRHLDRYPIAGQSLDPVLFHPAGGVGDKGMAIVELHPITGVGQYFGHETFEFQKFFFRQFMILLNDWSGAADGVRLAPGGQLTKATDAMPSAFSRG